MKWLIVLQLVGFGHIVSSVTHSLQYFYTELSGLSSFPEFVAVGMVDGVQIVHYDSISQRAEPKQAWMDQVTTDQQNYWERQKKIFEADRNVMIRLKKTGGAHILQQTYGCEWDDEDSYTGGYNQYGYNGEDFLSLDVKTSTWIAPVSEAVSTKQRWDQDRDRNMYLKKYFAEECIDLLKKYLDYGKNTFQRTELPHVSLLQRTPSSPVGCHATGFYPNSAKLFWTRDGQEVYEDVDHEVLPNHDGTFQVSVDLDLTLVPKEDWRRYQCVVQLKGIDDIFTILDPAHIRTNWEHKSDIPTILIIIGSVALLFASGVGLLCYKKRNGSATSPGTTDEKAPFQVASHHTGEAEARTEVSSL